MSEIQRPEELKLNYQQCIAIFTLYFNKEVEINKSSTIFRCIGNSIARFLVNYPHLWADLKDITSVFEEVLIGQGYVLNGDLFAFVKECFDNPIYRNSEFVPYKRNPGEEA
jgi:hypothetical protein